MKVRVSDLRAVCKKIFDHLEKNGNDIIEIPFDYYWNIPAGSRYDIDREPDIRQFDLGQLTDDLESINKIASGESSPIAYALVWIAQIFIVIGEKIVK